MISWEILVTVVLYRLSEFVSEDLNINDSVSGFLTELRRINRVLIEERILQLFLGNEELRYTSL